MVSKSPNDPLVAAHDAFASRDWDRALALFREAEASQPIEAEDIEAMGEAAWWGARPDDSIEALQRAYGAYLAAGKPARAAYVALSLAREYGVKLAGPIAASWLNRAKRILDAEPEGAEHGYLYLRQAVLASNEGSSEQAIELAKRTVELGIRVGDPNLQAMGTVTHGIGLIDKGELAEGLSLLDDAAVAATTGELAPYATGMVYCNTIAACCDVADYRRAGDWADAARRWTESHPGQPLIPGDCRIHQAQVLALRGAWAEAEESALRGAQELRAFNRLYHVGEAQYQVGEIRLRIGDLPAAREAFEQASELGRDPQPGLSMLALAEGRKDAAMSSIRRALEEEMSSQLERRRLLPAYIDIAVQAGKLAEAETAVEELEGIAVTYNAPTFEAAALQARGLVALAAGDPKGAARALRQAVSRWQEAEAPYDSARARVLLAQAIARQDDLDAALVELKAARAAFAKLGALPDVQTSDGLLLRLQADQQAAGEGRPVKAFLFTDIVRSTSLVEAIGDDAWLDLLRWHDKTLRALFIEHGGEEVDHAGDGFFVAFDDSAAAINCAVAIQRSLADHRRTHGFAPQVRVGVHATSAARSGGSYRGKGVHEAARIAAAAEGGEILVSRATLDASGGRLPASAPRTVSLRGISKPVELVAIDWRDGAG